MIFSKCVNGPSYCKGNDTCEVGYAGVLCENCDMKNHYAKSNGKCEKC